MFGLTRAPIDYQFWFIRDLIIIAIGAPLIWQLIRLGNWVLPISCMIWWAWNLPFPVVPSFEAITFFVLGAYAGQRRLSLFTGDRIWPVAGMLYPVLLAIEVYCSLPTGQPPAILHHVTLLFGLVSALSLTRAAVRHPFVSRLLLALSGASFFVFAVHEPALTVMRKLLYHALPPSQIMILSVYLLLPLLIIGMSLAIYFPLARIVPGLTAIITGGRAVKTPRPVSSIV